MPNVHLSQEELIALVLGARALKSMMPSPFTESIEALLSKLLDSLPPSGRDELRALQDHVDFVPSSIPSKGQEWVDLLMQAMRDERVVEMTYFALNKGKQTRRRVDPYHLRFFAGAWYFIAFDHGTKHFPVFNLARIRELHPNDDTFLRRQFSAASYFRDSVGITVSQAVRPVRIQLSGRAAATAEERRWPPGFGYTPNSDGTGVLTATLGSADDLMSWIASIGGDAELLADEGG